MNYRRKSIRRVSSGRIRPSLVVLGVVLTLCLIFFCWAQSKLRPLLLQAAKVKVEHLAAKAVNDAVARKIEAEGITYDNLISFEKDQNGQISALKTNMTSINHLKTSVTEEVLASLESLETSTIKIPLGNLIGGDLLAGRGPSVAVRIVPLGIVTASFRNQFAAAGINQTRHQIMLDISADMDILLPGGGAEVPVTCDVVVAETIIVGAVPDSFLSLDKGEK